MKSKLSPPSKAMTTPPGTTLTKVQMKSIFKTNLRTSLAMTMMDLVQKRAQTQPLLARKRNRCLNRSTFSRENVKQLKGGESLYACTIIIIILVDHWTRFTVSTKRFVYFSSSCFQNQKNRGIVVTTTYASALPSDLEF